MCYLKPQKLILYVVPDGVREGLFHMAAAEMSLWLIGPSLCKVTSHLSTTQLEILYSISECEQHWSEWMSEYSCWFQTAAN